MTPSDCQNTTSDFQLFRILACINLINKRYCKIFTSMYLYPWPSYVLQHSSAALGPYIMYHNSLQRRPLTLKITREILAVQVAHLLRAACLLRKFSITNNPYVLTISVQRCRSFQWYHEIMDQFYKKQLTCS